MFSMHCVVFSKMSILIVSVGEEGFVMTGEVFCMGVIATSDDAALEMSGPVEAVGLVTIAAPEVFGVEMIDTEEFVGMEWDRDGEEFGAIEVVGVDLVRAGEVFGMGNIGVLEGIISDLIGSAEVFSVEIISAAVSEAGLYASSYFFASFFSLG